MTLPSSGQLSLGDIANAFGFTDGSSTKLGDYRTTNGQGNFPVSFGALQFNSIDAQTGGTVPTSGQIKFSDFYSKSLNVIVDMHSGSTEFRKSVRSDKWNNNQVTVVGGFRIKKESGS